MASTLTSIDLRCTKCQVTFTQKSSLVRHMQRCLVGARGPSRQKSCDQCIQAKSRCTLTRPQCERCLGKQLCCRYVQTDNSSREMEEQPLSRNSEQIQASAPAPAPLSAVGDVGTGVGLGPLAKFPGLIQRAVSVQQHGLNHTIRVLRTYPLIFLRRSQLPPFMHHSQITADNLPFALNMCHSILSKMGYDSNTDTSNGHALHAEQSSHYQNQIIMEMKVLKQSAIKTTGIDLLASAQAFIIYTILILFPSNDQNSSNSIEEQIILDISELSLQLAAGGLALPEETSQDNLPLYQDWTLISAKRRTILTIYMITYAWSVRRNYPAFHCFELQLMLAPASRPLWQAQTENEWLPLYVEWHSNWKGDGYKIGELFSISATRALNKRTETWLEEVDEFGMLLMSLVNSV